jgi:hypothetical protein
MVYCEMAGRIAAVKHRPVFSLIRKRAGFSAGLATLVAANIVNLLTCAAEIGGVALLWELLSGWPYRALLAFALLFFLIVVWLLPFQWIERVFGLGGLLMIVFMVAVMHFQPDWSQVAAGFVPQLPATTSARDTVLYFYFARQRWAVPSCFLTRRTSMPQAASRIGGNLRTSVSIGSSLSWLYSRRRTFHGAHELGCGIFCTA